MSLIQEAISLPGSIILSHIEMSYEIFFSYQLIKELQYCHDLYAIRCAKLNYQEKN